MSKLSSGLLLDDARSATSSGEPKEVNGSLGLSFTEECKKSQASRLRGLRSMQESFSKTVDYHRYCQKNNAQRYYASMDSTTAKLIKKGTVST